MLSKMVVFGIILLGYILIQKGSHGDEIGFGFEPNVTGLTLTVSTSQKTSLYNKNISLFLSDYLRPVNTTHRQTLKVLKGTIDVNSTNQCIAMGYSFNLWGALPIKDNQAIGNGGCDALWGTECSQNIRLALSQSLGNISDVTCGVRSSAIINVPSGCPQPSQNLTFRAIGSIALLNNGSFAMNGTSPTDPTKTWAYYISDPLMDNDYDQVMKNVMFTYFVGRSYNSDSIDTAIACLSVYNTTTTITTTATTTTVTTPKTNGTDHGNMSIQLSRPANFLILLWSFIILCNIPI